MQRRIYRSAIFNSLCAVWVWLELRTQSGHLTLSGGQFCIGGGPNCGSADEAPMSAVVSCAAERKFQRLD